MWNRLVQMGRREEGGERKGEGRERERERGGGGGGEEVERWRNHIMFVTSSDALST